MLLKDRIMVSANDLDFEIVRSDLLRSLGYKADVEPSKRIASLLDKNLRKSRRIIKPSYSYEIKDLLAVSGNRASVEGGSVFESEIITNLLVNCKKVAIIISTIGGRLEEKVCSLAEAGLIVDAYMMDAIGSSAVEQLANLVQDRIGEIARSIELCISRRFSPGYCDWDISQQKAVFHALHGDTSGVHLTEEYLMLPQKSISGIIGVGLCDGRVEDYNPCNTCNKPNCLGRRRSTIV